MGLRIPYDAVKNTVRTAFLNLELGEERAEVCSAIRTQSSAGGVESHGLSRIPRFAEYIQEGWINLENEPELVDAKGTVENYDGHLGIGIIDALRCTDRAMGLTKVHGIGCVSLRNTVHWMRGGTYAWRMTEAEFMGVSWINTESCTPLWGSDEPEVGNNPFRIVIPRGDGPIILDMAISQHTYGRLGVYRLAGKEFPFPDGFDRDGNLTSDPGVAEEGKHILPTGYWKDSGMVTALDMATALMANGSCGMDMDEANSRSHTGRCQTFIAFDSYLFGNEEDIQAIFSKRVAAADANCPKRESGRVICPDERTIVIRTKNMASGVCVDEVTWAQVQSFTAGNVEAEDIANR